MLQVCAAAAEIGPEPDWPEESYAPGRVLVQIDPASKSAATTQLSNLQLTKKHTFALAHVELWDFDKQRSVQDVISAARRVQGVIGSVRKLTFRPD